MTKQGEASIKGYYDGKIEPQGEFVNPGAVSYLGEHLGNHADNKTFPLQKTPWDGGRGYSAPGPTPCKPGVGGGRIVHKSGGQGSH